MKPRKTIYLDVMSPAIIIIFLMLVFVFLSLGYSNLSRIFWLAISNFVIAGILIAYLVVYHILQNNFGNKYLYFDETGVEFKFSYVQEKLFLHWENISKILLKRRIINIHLSGDDTKSVQIKCPYEKLNEIQESFFQFAELKNIPIEHIR